MPRAREWRWGYLVLAAGTLAEVLALGPGHVAPFRVGLEDLEEIGMGVEAGVSVYAHTDAFSREGEGGDYDPFSVARLRYGEGFT